MPRAKSFKVSLNLPFGLGGVEQTWEPNDAERRAAWELYVELATRVATAPLQPNAGLHRDALDSLYALFAITREILRRYGPEVAQPNDEGFASFGTLAVTILNEALRPLLRTWHPLLQDHEDQRQPPPHASLGSANGSTTTNSHKPSTKCAKPSPSTAPSSPTSPAYQPSPSRTPTSASHCSESATHSRGTVAPPARATHLNARPWKTATT